MKEPLEIEVKLRFSDPDSARRAIEAAGGELVQGRIFEDNRIFDNPERSLSGREALLRVRMTSDGGGRLTYKEKVVTEIRAKVRREWEVEALPPETMAAILSRCGLEVIYRYQKYRTIYRIGGCTVDLDETPMGCFVEVEGPREAIPGVARLLGHGEETFITEDYRTLHLAWLDERGLSQRDMLFEQSPPEGRDRP